MEVIHEKKLGISQTEKKLKHFLLREAPLHQIVPEVMYPLTELRKALKQKK
jgi:hypothetical protein